MRRSEEEMGRSLRSGMRQSNCDAERRLGVTDGNRSHWTGAEMFLPRSHRRYSSGKEGSSQEKETVRFWGLR